MTSFANTLFVPLLIFSFVFILVATPNPAYAQRLREARNNVGHAKKKRESKPKHRTKDADHDSDHDDHRPDKRKRDRHDDNHGDAWVGHIVSGFLSSCTISEPCRPTTIVEVHSAPVIREYATTTIVAETAPMLSESVVANEVIFQPIVGPIVESTMDFADTNPVVNFDEVGADWFQNWCMRGRVTGGGGTDNLTFAGLDLLLQAPSSLGLDTSVKTWRENSNGVRDNLWLGDANLVFEFGNAPYVRSRVGLGVNWIADNWGSDAGFNLTAGLDLQLTQRWLVSLEGDVGTLGESDYLHSQASIARRFSNTELVVGYDFYDLGGAELKGVFGGLQFRF